MKEQAMLFESLLERAEDLARANAELYKLKAIDKVSDVAAGLGTRISLIALSFLFFIPLNIAFAFFLGEILNRTSLGFFIMAGFYALCALLFLLFRRKISGAVKDLIVSKSLK